jgi:hypothetical protein
MPYSFYCSTSHIAELLEKIITNYNDMDFTSGAFCLAIVSISVVAVVTKMARKIYVYASLGAFGSLCHPGMALSYQKC